MFFKKKIAENLGDKLTDLISKYREDSNYKEKAEIAREKSYKADKHMLGGLLVAGTGMAGGVAGLATSLHMGFGALALAGTGATIGGAIVGIGVLGIGTAGLAYMGISKLVKTYHESVAEKNTSNFGHIKEEYSVQQNFRKKIENALGGYGSELYKKAYEKGIVNDLGYGMNLDENAKKILEIRDSLNQPVVNKKPQMDIDEAIRVTNAIRNNTYKI